MKSSSAGLLIGLSLLLPAAAAAQDFPAKPIKLIVPFPPGGPNDIIARVVGQRMSELTKQPVVIDNRGGQAGVLGTDAVAKGDARRLHHRHRQRERARDQSDDGKGPLRRREGFRAGHAGATVPEMLVVAEQRARQEHGGAGRARQGAAGQTQFRVRRRRQPAASRRRIVQADRRRSTSCTCPIGARRPPSTICSASRCR